MQFAAKLAIAPGEFFTNFIYIILAYSEKYTSDISHNWVLSQSGIELVLPSKNHDILENTVSNHVFSP